MERMAHHVVPGQVVLAVQPLHLHLAGLAVQEAQLDGVAHREPAAAEAEEQVADEDDGQIMKVAQEYDAAGRIMAPGWSDPLLRAAWMCCEWSAQPMPNIDPKSTMEADRGYVELGAQTLDDVARNLNGSSGKANRMKNARQYAELPTPPWPRAPITSESASDRDADNT